MEDFYGKSYVIIIYVNMLLWANNLILKNVKQEAAF